jgi:hypothetical protein
MVHKPLCELSHFFMTKSLLNTGPYNDHDLAAGANSQLFTTAAVALAFALQIFYSIFVADRSNKKAAFHDDVCRYLISFRHPRDPRCGPVGSPPSSGPGNNDFSKLTHFFHKGEQSHYVICRCWVPYSAPIDILPLMGCVGCSLGGFFS